MPAQYQWKYHNPVPVEQVVKNLEAKAEWMMQNISVSMNGLQHQKQLGWFNGYYDNNGNPVERCRGK